MNFNDFNRLVTSKGVSSIYLISCKKNQKKYVGRTKIGFYRWKEHLTDFRLGRHFNKVLQEDFSLYGEENFFFDIILVCEKEQSLEYEDKIIDLYKTDNSIFGYNIGRNDVPFYRLRDRNASRNYKHSESTKKLIGEKSSNRVHSEETKKKISNKLKGNSWNKGKKLTEEHKNKIRESYMKLNYRHSEEIRKKISSSKKSKEKKERL